MQIPQEREPLNQQNDNQIHHDATPKQAMTPHRSESFSIPSQDDESQFVVKKEEKTIECVSEGQLRRTSGIKPLFDDWILEILSCFLAILALAAIIITLAIHQGRGLPEWPRLISINTLIAVFTAILKAALLLPVAEGISQLKWGWFKLSRRLIDLQRLDSASRGPWGSFRLLIHARKHYLAMMGAIITVAALAVDPFAQQVVRYVDCQAPLEGVIASIPRTNNYTAHGYYYTGRDMTLDNAMSAGIYMGVFNPPANESSNIPVVCPTGNCTFPENNGITHSSIAMCHQCEDVTSEIKVNTTAPPDLPSWILPSTAGGTTRPNALTNATIGYDEYDFSYVSVTDSFYGTPGMVFQFNAAMLVGDCPNATSPKCDMKPFGVSCGFYPCVKSYHSEVKNFVLDERVLDSRPMTDNGGIFADFFTAQNQTTRNGKLEECLPSPDKTDINTFNATYFMPNATNRFYPNDCFYSWSSYSSHSIQNFLETVFFQPFQKQLANPGPKNINGSVWLANLWLNGAANTSSVDKYITGIANGMTTVIRTKGEAPEETSVKGKAWRTQTCVRVQWAWLALPACLTILAVIFLIATIMQAKSGKQLVWKSSSLALVFHGLRHSDQGDQSLATRDQMAVYAEQMRAQLALSDEGWKFESR